MAGILDRRALWSSVLTLLVLPAQADETRTSKAAAQVIATVNDVEITAGTLDLVYLRRRIPDNRRAQLRGRFIEELIDRQLVSEFLDSRKVAASDAAVDAQLKLIEDLIRKRKEEPASLLKRMGYTRESLRAELSIPLRWRAYAREVITAEKLREYWGRHRNRFDGTQLRAGHLLIKLPPEATAAQVDAVREKLDAVRENLAAGKTTFTAATAKHSQAPSASTGGDVGFFPIRGKMHPTFADAAFSLKPGEVSAPVRTPFGLHLITITDRRPGQLSLEDVCNEVFARVAQDRRAELIAQQRKAAKIVRAE
ncbi:MAG: hypothetical protein CMJ48_02610 [Planctomycetaceae bacterium]|nr:hypothetical protein [Planctomycetaceae bacterium]